MTRSEINLLVLLSSIVAIAAFATTFTPPLASRTPYQYVAFPSNRTFDYVIIGAGLAGLTVAARLAETPGITVGVIEAGDFYENVNGNKSRVPGYGGSASAPGVDWAIPPTPQPQLNRSNVTNYRQGKCVGGSTTTNLMAYHRSTKGAYDLWASLVGDTGYTFSNFLPWMRKSVHFTPANSALRAKNASVPAAKAESYDRNGGPFQVTFANWANPVSSYAELGWKALGLFPLQDLTSGTLIGNQYSPMALKASDQSRSTSASSFLQYAVSSGRNNLFIFTNSMARRITFDNNKRAHSIIAQSNGLIFELKAKQEVVLSAGVIHSPQILLLSGIGPSETLNKFNIPVVKDLPGVGKNLHDHPIFQFVYQANAVTGSSLFDPAFADAAAKEYDKTHTGILTHNMADHFAWGKIPLNQLSSQAKSDLASLPADWPHYEVVVADVGFGPGNYAEGVAMLQAVTSRGIVSISSTSIDDPPLLDVKTLSTATDLEVAIGTFKTMRQFFNTTSLRKITGAEVIPGPDVVTDEQIHDWLLLRINPGSHGCCTSSMGKLGDMNAVVDTTARVMGVKNLRVVDASALPLLPPAHPVSTLYGFAEKIADDIKKSYVPWWSLIRIAELFRG
ncbi:alcohol oxidase [Lindgomyces ingoldianus]|uniref:Alcohol oxidase n=1 Tax=Lindgomyces ingoldianus TaxID=673940 RepID=A0ACB6REQ5_9PLEO|nr:alcohol oxidase [Lindgomyces ingoldianus]KAF2476812.1 alcohol oxidase [Lindgomyces ingoldianus]